MTDAARRETSLLMGVGCTAAIVAVIVFSVTGAMQQVRQRTVRWQELRGQLDRVERQAERRAKLPSSDQLRIEVQAAGQLFVDPASLGAFKGQLESLAAASGVTITFLPSLAPESPARPLPGFERCYEAIPLVATIEARYRGLAAYLNRVTTLMVPLVTLRSCTVDSAQGQRLTARVVFETFRWIPGALPAGPIPPPAAVPPLAAPSEGWGRDPFDPRYLGTPSAEGITLEGIVWDPHRPTCILNGTVVGVGEGVNGYTVVAIEPKVVILRGERELVLTVSS